MCNVPKSWGIEDYPDIATRTYYDEQMELRQRANPGIEPDMIDVMAGLQHKGKRATF